MKILLLEDDFALRISIQESLQAKGIFIDAFANGTEAAEKIWQSSYDLYLLDIEVPGLSGFEVLQKIRKKELEIPVILMSVYSQIEYIRDGYKLGCSDYLKKPFELEELCLRVEQINKLLFSQNTTVELQENYSFDMQSSQLFFNGDIEVRLNKKEKLLMYLLCKYHKQTVSYDMISEYVWNEYTSSGNIRYYIHSLTKKLPKDSISNVKGIGYKLN